MTRYHPLVCALALHVSRSACQNCDMTTLSVIDGNGGETLTVAVARRLRGQMAEKRITNVELAKRTGWGRQMVSRRVNGETALNTDELETIEAVAGISAIFLLTGHRVAESPRPDDPDGGSSVRHQGLEPRTR